MTHYLGNDKFNIAVDCIIFGFDSEGLKLLLLKRSFEPAKGKWSLMGGFLKSEESLDDAAARVLANLTGLNGVYLEQLAAFGDVNRDPGDRVISAVYFALINIDDSDRALVEKHNAHWVLFKEAPELIFDHNAMVNRSLKRLRRKAATEPIGFNLLPEKFTLTHLQRMYEAIFQHELDKRNFRKKMLQMNVLEKLDEKDKESSKRGAFLYCFNAKKYQNLISEGSTFGI